jgi:hypothetical protein
MGSSPSEPALHSIRADRTPRNEFT